MNLHRPLAALLVLSTGLAVGPTAWGDDNGEVTRTLERLLAEGDLDGATRAMESRLEEDDRDDAAWFGLGLTRFLKAVETLGQANHRYGVMQQYAGVLPLLRMPTPMNDSPRRIAYEDARNELKTLLAALDETQKALGKVDTSRDVKLRLHIGRYRLDLDGDGKATDAESFWRIFQRYNNAVRREHGEEFLLGLDGGDVHWLKGYTHFLSAVCEIALAHDFREIFERTAHLFYPKVDTPHEFLQPSTGDVRTFLDAIAFIHLLNFEVEEPARMKSALAHLETMVDESRLSWKRILAETDDDREWLPNPEQTSVLPRGRVRREMIDGWHVMLDEIDALLKGDKLIPFWRDYLPRNPLFLFGNNFEMVDVPKRGRGVNLRKVFTQPRDLDFVMWLQGTGATPFLENGELSQPETWGRVMRVFRGEFFGFAIWFN